MRVGTREILIWRSALLTAWTVFLLYMTLSSDPSQSKEARWLSDLCASIGLPKQTPAKTFHFISYAIWVWLAFDLLAERQMRLRTKAQAVLILALLMVLASGQEALQYLNADRHPSMVDVLTNAAGGMTCLALRLLMDRGKNVPPGDEIKESA